MKILKVMFVCMLAIAVFSGCAARSLSVLQAEFNEAVKTKQMCKTPDDKIAPDESCLADFDTIFADITAQAEKSLKDHKGGHSVKIGLHRLHAYALWQSGASEKEVVTAAQNGVKECGGDNYNKAPRDCDLLETVGIFKIIEETAAKITLLKKEDMMVKVNKKKGLCSKRVKEWREEVTKYWHDAYVPLVEKIKKIAKKEGVSKSVLVYLEDQRKKAQAPIFYLRDMAKDCVPDWADKKLIAKCPCDPGERKAEHREVCDKVYDKENPSFTLYHETLCINNALRKSENCPCEYKALKKSNTLEDAKRKACEYIETNPESKKLFDSKCQVEQALK